MPCQPPPAAHRIFVDVSGVLRHGRGNPQGIPRVEGELCRHVLADPRVEPVWFDRAVRSFVRLRPPERAYLDSLMAEAAEAQQRDGGHPRYSWTDRLYLDRRSFRVELAARLIDPQARSAGARIAREAIYAGAHLCYAAIAVSRKFRRYVRGINESVGSRPGDSAGSLLVADRSAQHIARSVARPVRLVHDLIPIEYPEFFGDGGGFLARMHMAAQICSRLLCVSEATRGEVARWLEEHHRGPNCPSLHVAQLPGFLHDKAMTEGWHGTATRSARPFILYCSTIDPRKNHLVLLDAYRRLLEDHLERGGPAPPELHFVGHWNRRSGEIRTKFLGEPRFDGWLRVFEDVGDEELCGLYRSALFTVYPSIREGWGLGVSESLDFGTPVVVSTDPALVEASQGLMPALDPHDVGAWYEEMRRLSFDSDYRETLRKRVRERYHRRSVAAFAADVLNALNLDDGAEAVAGEAKAVLQGH